MNISGRIFFNLLEKQQLLARESINHTDSYKLMKKDLLKMHILSYVTDIFRNRYMSILEKKVINEM